ncbi:MAG: hypothetical protein KBS86_01210 [Proteobacteria bacterium]|nr:hypothetical protein [Candidatus Enterousia scatequi]
MKPEQFTWSTKQWAEYIGCSESEFMRFNNEASSMFNVAICKVSRTQKYRVVLEKRHDTPSGAVRYIWVALAQKEFSNPIDATKYANEVFIPSLELKRIWAQTYNMPRKILQTLHIRTL